MVEAETIIRDWWSEVVRRRDPLFPLMERTVGLDYWEDEHYSGLSLHRSFVLYTNYELGYTSFLNTFRRVTGIEEGKTRNTICEDERGTKVYTSTRRFYRIVFP